MFQVKEMIEYTPNLRKAVRALGTILVLVALFFVFEKIWTNRLWLFDRRPTKQIVMVIMFGSVGYALSCLLLSVAWRRLLNWLGQPKKALKNCHAVYARTQIAKYIPGNMFHVAGRHVLGRQVGLDHGPLAGAAVYEIAGILVVSSAIALLGILFYGTGQTKVSVLSILAIFIIALTLPIIINKLIVKYSKFRGIDFHDKKITEIMIGLIPVYLLYLVFFLIIGGILFWVVHVISDLKNIHHAGLVITTFAVSWFAGFITPGASAGVGIRETIIVLSLTNILGEPQSLFIAIIFRVITVVGDFVFFLSSFLMPINLSGGKEKNIRPLKHN